MPLVDNVMRQTANTGGTFETYVQSLPEDIRKAMERQGQFEAREDDKGNALPSIQQEAFENLKKEAERVTRIICCYESCNASCYSFS